MSLIVPGLALAVGWVELKKLFPEPVSSRLGMSLLLFIGLIPACANLLEEFEYTPEEDLLLMAEVAAVTDGAVFDARGLLYDRPHVGFYPWLHHGLRLMLDPDTYSQETMDALEVAGYPPYLEDYRSAEYPSELRTFLSEFYLPAEVEGLHRYGFRLTRSRLMGSGLEVMLPVSGRWKLEGQGGVLLVNGETVKAGEVLELPAGACRIQAKGFVRNAQLLLLEAMP